MERKENLERKLSRKKSESSRSLWSRKSLKKPASAPLVSVPAPKPPTRMESKLQKEKQREEEGDNLEEIKETPDHFPTMVSQSIIPDPLREPPVLYHKDDGAIPLINAHRMRYPLHNPFGPRRYRNHHLIPPSQLRPSTRPPSIFSPSFPPMTLSMNERLDEAMQVPGPSRTPSGSPLPTPTSSQTGIADSNIKARSRKTSQTAHDTVDLLDVTDPWGTNWHHQSPYDIGLSNGTVTVDSAEVRIHL